LIPERTITQRTPDKDTYSAVNIQISLSGQDTFIVVHLGGSAEIIRYYALAAAAGDAGGGDKCSLFEHTYREFEQYKVTALFAKRELRFSPTQAEPNVIKLRILLL
jgi:hypothetical protein